MPIWELILALGEAFFKLKPVDESPRALNRKGLGLPQGICCGLHWAALALMNLKVEVGYYTTGPQGSVKQEVAIVADSDPCLPLASYSGTSSYSSWHAVRYTAIPSINTETTSYEVRSKQTRIQIQVEYWEQTRSKLGSDHGMVDARFSEHSMVLDDPD